MDLSASSIDNAIAELTTFRDSLNTKKYRLLEALAKIGLSEASVRFTTAMYDGTNDSNVRVELTHFGYRIVAQGHAVFFIEFGAGVYHNPGEPYPNPRPSGVVGIGQYGKGYGKRKAWGYKDESGELFITHGNPAAMPMWYANKEMRKNIEQIAQEVFGA
jgi:hypothetical protein